MVTISDVAVEEARKILSMEGKSHWGLRVYLAGSSCCGPSFGMDINEHPAEGDEIIEKDGLKVFIDKTASEKLNGMEIHFVNEGAQQGFTITNKNQPPSCGPECGSSCG